MNAATKMEQHALEQGSAAWLAHRSACNNASEAGAMLGVSPYTSRSQLIAQAHSGLARDHSRFVEELVLPDGHRTEALLRPLAEEIIGEDLYAIVGTRLWPGITRPLGASFDGLTIVRDAGFECKRLNEELRKALPHGDIAGNDQQALPKYHRAQIEQQFMVCPTLERILFGAGEFDRDGNLVDARWVWCTPDPQLRAELVAGWKQFEADLAEYVPSAEPIVAKVVAESVEALPAVIMQVSGQITLQDNFRAFETALQDFLEHRLIRKPTTDQDFADLDAQIKAMKGAEAALDAAEGQMLAQITAVDQAKRTKDALSKLVRENRLMAEKLLSAEKDRRRTEIVTAGTAALREHCAKLDQRLGKPLMPAIAADFAGCVKGLKSLASMEEKVANELARAKIAANEIADRITANLNTLRELASDYRTLFADAGQLVLKAEDDCRAVVTARIAEHKAAEEKRLEAERERIRAEEVAKLAREQADREAAERRQQEEAARAATPAPTTAPAAAPAPTVSTVVAMQRPTAAPAPAAPATLTLGAICQRLGFTVTADFVKTLGFEPTPVDKAAKKYTEAQFVQLCHALVSHIGSVSQQQQAA